MKKVNYASGLVHFCQGCKNLGFNLTWWVLGVLLGFGFLGFLGLNLGFLKRLNLMGSGISTDFQLLE